MRTAKSCGPDASMLASSCERCLAYDGDNQARSPGRARYKLLKPLRAGMPGDSGEPRGDYARVVLFFSHARLRVHRAPGISHALSYFLGGQIHASLGRKAAARTRRCVLIPPPLWGGWHIVSGANECRVGVAHRNAQTDNLLKQPPPVSLIASRPVSHPPHASRRRDGDRRIGGGESAA